MKKGIVSVVIVSILLCSCGTQIDSTGENPIYATKAIEESVMSEEEEAVGDACIGEALFVADFQGVGEYAGEVSEQRGLYNNSLDSIVCSDEQGNVYYVNYGVHEDNYIYSYCDGDTKLLVDKICNFINYYEGCLYFLVDDKAPEEWPFSWGGQLYRYDLSTAELSMILDKNVYNLYVREGIFYFQNEIYIEDGKVRGNEWMYMPMEEREPKAMGRLLPFFWGEYQLGVSETGPCNAKLLLIKGEEEIPITNEYDYYWKKITVEGDCVWISSRMENGMPAIASINLVNGEHHFYPASSRTPSGATMGTDIGLDFMVFHGNLYVVTHSTIFKYDEELECFDKFVWDQTGYSGLYMDGEWLYGLSVGNNSPEYHSNGLVRFKGDGSEREVIAE